MSGAYQRTVLGIIHGGSTASGGIDALPREPPHLHPSETPAEAAPQAAAWTSYELESTRTRSILGYLECVTIPVAAAAAAEDCLAVGAAEFFKDARLWKVLLVSRTTYVVGLQ